MKVINVILVDDHVLVRNGIKALLEDEDGIHVINEASNSEEALQILKKITDPTLFIIDIRMPGMNGIDLVKEINKKNTNKHIQTLMLSMHDSEEYVIKSIQVGADGYLLKGASKEEFLKALNKIANGGKYFTGDVSAIIMDNFVSGNTLKKEVLKDTTTNKDLFKLTKREKQILGLILELKNNKDIAEELKISKRTVEVHRFNLMRKLNVKNIMELNNKAHKYNLV